MSTPHNNAKKGDIADIVLMPGDPLRAKYIAENFLTDAICYNEVRNMYGFTGYYKGKRISVQGSGMGMPSAAIYSYELYKFYDVEAIIRVGTIGGLADKVNLRDIIIAEGACTNSAFLSQYNLNGTYSPIADFGLLRKAVESAEALGVTYHVGNILSSDTFYSADSEASKKWADMGVLGIEMESAAIYSIAASLGKKALCITTVSDHIFKNEETTAEERQNGFTDMMKIALETAIS